LGLSPAQAGIKAVPVTPYFRSNDNEAMKTLTIAALTLAMITAASAQTSTTIRDASGRITGTVTNDSNGTKTFRDGSGRTTGTATRDSNGTTTFRDAGGRTTGTATAPRR
jgi:YD repeat-containing protein